MSDLVGNPDCLFFHVKVHFVLFFYFLLIVSYNCKQGFSRNGTSGLTGHTNGSRGQGFEPHWVPCRDLEKDALIPHCTG